jgi:hypothetical protein
MGNSDKAEPTTFFSLCPHVHDTRDLDVYIDLYSDPDVGTLPANWGMSNSIERLGFAFNYLTGAAQGQLL